MTTIEILEDLFFIERGYLNANHFVYRSPLPILIDTGYIADFKETQRLITGLGVNLGDISRIINTHAHCDHIGGNKYIQQASGCDIALHKVGKHFIDTRDGWATWWRYYGQEAEFFDCTIGLDDGDLVRIGPHEFQVIYTPGHASDGIVLYHPKEKILLSSDTLWEKDMAVMTLRVEGSAALFHMQASLGKLASLEVERVYPGHGGPFDNFQKALQKSNAKIETYLMDRERMGSDLIKKIIVYSLMMRKGFDEGGFFPYLMTTHWYRETVDLYFNGDYETKYDEVMRNLMDRGIIIQMKGKLLASIKP